MTRAREVREYWEGLNRHLIASLRSEGGNGAVLLSGDAQREFEARARRDWDAEWARMGRARVSDEELLASFQD